MQRTAAFVVVMVLLALFLKPIKSAESEAAQTEYTSPFPIVMMPENAHEAHKQLARELAESLDIKFVQEATTNPVCCVWVEISRYMPNPGSPGYVIIHQPGGSIISASNFDQLRLAVERIKKSIRRRNGEAEVPVGLTTSYPVIVEPTR